MLSRQSIFCLCDWFSSSSPSELQRCISGLAISASLDSLFCLYQLDRAALHLSGWVRCLLPISCERDEEQALIAASSELSLDRIAKNQFGAASGTAPINLLRLRSARNI